jgi:hypothetical protein
MIEAHLCGGNGRIRKYPRLLCSGCVNIHASFDITINESDADKFNDTWVCGSQQVLVSKELLAELKQGIFEAIYCEDGLDGADGVYLLSGINIALGLDETDGNPP